MQKLPFKFFIVLFLPRELLPSKFAALIEEPGHDCRKRRTCNFPEVCGLKNVD